MRIRTRSMLIIGFQGLTQATQLIIGIVLVRLISKEMLGSYRQVMLVYSLMVGILTMQIESSLYYFLPKYGEERRRDLIASTLLSVGIISFIIAVSMFFSANLFVKNFNNPEIAELIRIYAYFAIFEGIVKLLPAFLISLDKVLLSGIYSMFNAVFIIVAVIFVFALGYGLKEALISKIAVEAIFGFFGILIIVYFSPQGQWRINKGILLEQWNYCWPLMAMTTVGIINVKLDGVLISSYFSKDVYAVYSTGAIELPIIVLFTASLSSAIMPNMVAEAHNGLLKNSLNIWLEASRKSSLLIFPIFVFFLVCGHDFIVLLYTEEYSKATWPFLIYLARLPIRVAIYGAIFRAIGHTKPLFFAAIFSLLSNLVISMFFLIIGKHGFFSYIGPSIGTFFGTFISGLYLLIILCKKIDVRFSEIMRWKEMGQIFTLSLLCGLLLWLTPVPFSDLISKFITKTIFYTIYFFCALLLTKSLKSDELELLQISLIPIKRMIKIVRPGFRNK